MKNIILVLLILSGISQTGFAQNLCESNFLTQPIDIVESENITQWEKNYFLNNLKLIPTNDPLIYVVLNKAIDNWGNPYSRSYDFRLDSLKYKLDPKNDFYQLMKFLMNSKNNVVLTEFLNEWINTEYRAVFVYDLLIQIGISKYQDVFETLLQKNVFFMDANVYTNKDGQKNLITYSFEKEGSKSEISYYFKLPNFKENDWLSLNDSSRMNLLKTAKLPEKQFVSADLLSPTQLKPSYIGGFSLEWSGVLGQKGWSWEIAHKNYEISRDILKNQIKEITQFFEETHSVHVHIVFEIPKNYEKYQDFIRWVKLLNDFIYLKGMEEGLHGNELTHIMNLPDKMTKKELFMDYLNGLSQPSNIAREQQVFLTKRSMKYFSAGLRTNMYGNARAEEFIKVGIELRDTTRNLQQINEYIDFVTEMIQNKTWESTMESNLEYLPSLTTSEQFSKKALKHFIKDFAIDYLIKANDTVALPMMHFERIQNKLTDDDLFDSNLRKIMTQARVAYLNDLVQLETEIANSIKTTGKPLEPEIIDMAIKISLSEWAKKVKVSDVYRDELKSKILKQ